MIWTGFNFPASAWRHLNGNDVNLKVGDNYEVPLIWRQMSCDKLDAPTWDWSKNSRWAIGLIPEILRDAKSRSSMNGFDGFWCSDTSMMLSHGIQCHIDDGWRHQKFNSLSSNRHDEPRIEARAIPCSRHQRWSRSAPSRDHLWLLP